MEQYFILLAVALTVSNGFAANAGPVDSFDSPTRCQKVRLDRIGGPFDKIPVYNQKVGSQSDPDICYAIAAAELTDAYRFQHGDSLDRLTSPLSIALKSRATEVESSSKPRPLNSNLDDSDPITFMIGGGSITGALGANRGNSVCDQRWLESNVKLINDTVTAQPVDRFLLDSVPSGSDLNSQLISKAISAVNSTCAGHTFPIQFPEPKEQDQPGNNRLMDELTLATKLQSHSLSEEEGKKLTEDFLSLYDHEHKIQTLGETVTSLMDGANPHAVGIGYLYSAVQATGNEGSTGAHASVIIGRRISPETGKCEFLVRDSYGSSCLDKAGHPRYSLPCENGSIWINSRSLMEQTVSLTWIP